MNDMLVWVKSLFNTTKEEMKSEVKESLSSFFLTNKENSEFKLYLDIKSKSYIV